MCYRKGGNSWSLMRVVVRRASTVVTKSSRESRKRDIMTIMPFNVWFGAVIWNQAILDSKCEWKLEVLHGKKVQLVLVWMRAQSRLTFFILAILDKQWSSRRNGWKGNWNATLSVVSPGISDALLANILLWLLWAYGVWIGVCWGRWERPLRTSGESGPPNYPGLCLS